MGTAAEADREFWRGVLAAGGFTAIPRWTLDPVPGVGEHEATVPDDVAGGAAPAGGRAGGAAQLGAAGRARQGARRAVRRARGRRPATSPGRAAGRCPAG